MKNNHRKHLNLSKQTLVNLTPAELTPVQGGRQVPPTVTEQTQTYCVYPI